MGAETATQVAWIGVLAGLGGGLVVGLFQYVLHHVGSRLKWRDELRSAVADFLANVRAFEMATVTRETETVMNQVHLLEHSYRRVFLLAPKSLFVPAGLILKESLAIVAKALADEDLDYALKELSAPHDKDKAEAYAEFTREARRILKVDKMRV